MEPINYEEFDEHCIKLVKLFNEELELPTKYSCQGHEYDPLNAYSIMFQDHVSDADIENLIVKFTNKYNHSCFQGKFVKWCRVMCGEIKYNWIYQVTTKSDASNYSKANQDYLMLKNRNK